MAKGRDVQTGALRTVRGARSFGLTLAWVLALCVLAPAGHAQPTLSPPGVILEAPSGPALDHRGLRAQDLFRRYARDIEIDRRGEAVVRGEVLAVGASADALRKTRAAGFRVKRVDKLPEIDLELTVLGAPLGMPVDDAVDHMRALDPIGQYDVNPVYLESGMVVAEQAAGATSARTPARTATAPARTSPTKIGMIDGGVDVRHRSLARSKIDQRSFVRGGVMVTPHGTAVASLLAGLQEPFRGAAPGATLYVADAFGESPTGGSAAILVRALAWLAQCGAPVINISLVGPANTPLALAVQAMVRRGYVLVSPIGNDGPASRAYYPAAYPGVVAVAPVDRRKRRLVESSRSDHVDFTAPGADMAAAAPLGGFLSVRGSSFASPLVAGSLAKLMTVPDPAARTRALDLLGRQAEDLGAPGIDPVFGRGLVAFDLRTEPVAVDTSGRR
ncbi:S8 family serine peptidase [Phenylobacterium sp.]|uniref:S8 family serine peptidase n=1 Tax=Phenylobacterium sp. TaxID=1871053 RepID=UPI0027326F0A|nr:S8 family serine peptidase [Phenylobacterium sp.]MDP3660534.1 S8 family serine peptidase [Phenylobacterium sp.]